MLPAAAGTSPGLHSLEGQLAEVLCVAGALGEGSQYNPQITRCGSSAPALVCARPRSTAGNMEVPDSAAVLLTFLLLSSEAAWHAAMTTRLQCRKRAALGSPALGGLTSLRCAWAGLTFISCPCGTTQNHLCYSCMQSPSQEPDPVHACR